MGMKKKAVSKIAKSKNAKAVVFHGTKEKTLSGLTKADLIKNKNGKIVSKKKLAAGKKAYAHIKGWTVAVQKARKAFGCQGLRCSEEGNCSLQEGQGALPVSICKRLKATAQGVGMSTPFERRSFGHW